METLATRVGRFESELEALRREVSQLQGQSSSDARSGSGMQASELQLQWVRLFEKELEQLRRQAESYKEPIAVLEERLTRLERVAGWPGQASPESGRDLDELAELVLTELQALKQKVYQLAAPKRQGVALHGGASAPPMPQLTNAGAAIARVEQLQRLEQSTTKILMCSMEQPIPEDEDFLPTSVPTFIKSEEDDYTPPTRSWDITPLNEEVRATLAEVNQRKADNAEGDDDQLPTVSWELTPDVQETLQKAQQRKSFTLLHEDRRCDVEDVHRSGYSRCHEIHQRESRAEEGVIPALLKERERPRDHWVKRGDNGWTGCDGSQLQKRLQHLEDEVQIGMQPLKRHQVSLQVLEETSMKVEKLQETLKLLPLDLALQRSEDAFKALEDVAHRSTGQMSLLDGYKVQSSLDQLYSAMEALVRQRSADVQLVNSYLGEVYQRIERDLPSDKGQGIIQSLEQLQNQHQLLKAECRALTDVRIPELEAKLSHEASAAAVLAQGNRQQIIKLEVATQEAVNQLTATQARLPALQDATERRAVQDGRREALVAELRKAGPGGGRAGRWPGGGRLRR
ncbi:unnamed protein product [Cladocopium goreaui]|uniref:MATH domain-containing protein n=1 Tax=Cladocopium goreaui TaxID=2562237 RepID=A0A9P1GSL5_9DINO|nr:unnamed protein product [Cladocopium goreaui]